MGVKMHFFPLTFGLQADGVLAPLFVFSQQPPPPSFYPKTLLLLVNRGSLTVLVVLLYFYPAVAHTAAPGVLSSARRQ